LLVKVGLAVLCEPQKVVKPPKIALVAARTECTPSGPPFGQQAHKVRPQRPAKLKGGETVDFSDYRFKHSKVEQDRDKLVRYH